jgi:glycosyltransferase involved in cell wall biosynthesis
MRGRGRLNVVLLTNGLGLGGAEVVIRDLARSIDRDRFNVSVCCLRLLGPIGRELAAEGVDISVLGLSGLSNYLAGLQLRRFVRDKQIDIIHTHTLNALSDAAMCRTLVPGLKLVHTFHFGNYPNRPSRILWMERIAARFADRLVAVGRVQREQIKAVHFLRDHAIGVIRNGVPLPQPSTGDPTFRAGIGADNGILVGTIATLIPQKGLFDLLAVARRVRDVRDDVRFVVVGEGDLRAELLQKRAELGLDDVVTFTGWMANAAARVLPTFDIYFQPSLWEAMSISILEAMAAGKPVVSTLVGEAPHLIEQGVEGLLFAPGDVGAMSDALLALAADPASRLQMGTAAAKKVAAHFTVGHMARAHEALYQDLMPHRFKELSAAV